MLFSSFQNIEKFINESTHGVIYFSLGSMIKGHTFPQEKKDAFLRAFARLPQRVLWKWENETMPGKPDNVMIQKWMPQFDILCTFDLILLYIIDSYHCRLYKNFLYLSEKARKSSFLNEFLQNHKILNLIIKNFKHEFSIQK